MCLCTVARAQTAVGDLTTGSSVPENAILPSAPVGRTQTFTLGITEGIGETDNVAQTPTDHRSQTLELTGIDFGWIRTGSALDANVAGNFDYLAYLQNAYGAQLLGRLDGLTTLSLFSDHFRWILQDDFGEGQLDPYTPATPSNQENINVVTTGPEVILRPSSQTLIQLDARYADTTYQTSPLNGWRTTESALLERLLSANSNVGIGVDFEQLRFDNTDLNEDYDRSRYYVRYEITGARTHITALVGEGEDNDGGNWYSTPSARFDISHKVSQETSVSFTAGRELTDAADTFTDLRSGAAGGIVVAPTAASSGDYLRNYVSAGIQITGRQTSVGLTADWERDTYNDAADAFFNVTRGDLELSVNRKLSRVLSAGIFGDLTQSRYIDQDGEINSRLVGAQVQWQAGRTLSVEGRYSHDFQGSFGGGYGFSANAIFLTVTYRPFQLSNGVGSAPTDIEQ